MIWKIGNVLMMPEESTTTSSGTGAESSPSPAPAAPAPDNAGAGSDASVDWTAESADLDDAGPAPSAPAPKASPALAPVSPVAAPAAPTTPAAGTVAPVPQPASQPAAAPEGVQPAAPAATAAPVAAPPAAKTPEQIAAETAAAAKATQERFDGLVKQYQLPDDLAARLPTEPEQVLPYLAAKVHEHVMAQVEQMVASQVPGQIHQVMETTRRNQEAKDTFYKAWPSLNEAEHGDKVLMVGALFRQLNPHATREQAVERIGQVVHAALGLPLPQRGGNGQQAPVQQAPAAAPKPFVPAGGGGSGRTGAAPTDNEWAQMAESLLMDDAGH